MKSTKLKNVDVTAFDQTIRYNDDQIEKLPYGYQLNHREMGWKNLRSGQYEAAIKNLHEAAAVDPNDIRTLVGRGKARTKIMLYEGATADAHAVLRQDSYDKDAIYLEAFCSNDLGNFEQSLLMYRRGINKRGRRREFQEGQLALEATLENTLGRHSGSALTDLEPSIKEMQRREKRKQDLSKKTNKDCLEELIEKKKTKCSSEAWNRYQKRLKRKNQQMAAIYLGKLSKDREWWKEMMNTTEFKNSDTSIGLVKDWAAAASKELDQRFQNLYSRKPLYHFIHRFKPCRNLADRQQKAYTSKRQTVETDDFRRMLQSLEVLANREQFREAMCQAERIKDKLDNTTTSYLPTKKEVLAELCQIMCFMYLDFTKLRPDLSKQENKLRLSCMNGLDHQFLESKYDVFVQKSHFPFLYIPGRLKKFREYIKCASSANEKAWLYYETARMQTHFKKWDYVVQDAQKCIQYAKEFGDQYWIVNGQILIIQGEVQRRDRAEGLKVLKECFDASNKLHLEDTIAYLLELRNVIDATDEGVGCMDAMLAIKRREEAILCLMKDRDTKEAMRDVFARMRALPPHRRMSILPGIPMPVKKNKGETTNKSIIPGGIGGRLGMHPITYITYREFLGLPSANQC